MRKVEKYQTSNGEMFDSKREALDREKIIELAQLLETLMDACMTGYDELEQVSFIGLAEALNQHYRMIKIKKAAPKPMMTEEENYSTHSTLPGLIKE